MLKLLCMLILAHSHSFIQDAPNSPYWQDYVNYQELLDADDMDLAAELEAAVHAQGEPELDVPKPVVVMDMDVQDEFTFDLTNSTVF